MSTIEMEVVQDPNALLAPPQDWRAELGLTDDVIGDLVGRFERLPQLEEISREANVNLQAVSDAEYQAYNNWASAMKSATAVEDTGRFQEIDGFQLDRFRHRDETAKIAVVGRDVISKLARAMVPGRYHMGDTVYEFFEDKYGQGHLARIDYAPDPHYPQDQVEVSKTCLSENVPFGYQEEYRFPQGEDYVRLLTDIIYGEDA